MPVNARRSRRSGPSRCRRRGCMPSSRGSCHSSAPLGGLSRCAPAPRRTAGSCVFGPAVGGARAEARHRLDAGGDEHVALAGLDRVERHPGGLQRRRAVPVDGGAGQEVVAELDGDDAGDVVAGLTGGLAAAPWNRRCRRVERRDLVQRGAHHLAARSSGRMSWSDPLTARPIGERAGATMTASGMTVTLPRGAIGRMRTAATATTG